LGIRTRFANANPGEIVHGIVPEGDNLELCRRLLEQAHREDPSFLLGYVPDNDGDRGNIAWIDERTGCASILGAQELFALVAAVELSHPSAGSRPKAVAVNCPTSLMIDEM
jgi:phosphomannomutase